ncbi:hypothetical protein [Paratractidigestivibacter sp.]|uniref:hypothetical protein n=1 Tax=Paratractidigestivibacter sp. TaxID=2847316 RepID=UPI002AC8B1C9|nr:hypothetical protein [Paratractidigestivibacter sp.]
MMIVPDMLSNVFVPVNTMFVMVPVAPCVLAHIGGLIAALTNVTTYVLGATNILGITGYDAGGTANLVWGCIASAAAFISAAAIAFLFGFTKEELDADAEEAAASK